MPNAITRRIDAYIMELRAAAEADARQRRRKFRAGIVAGSAFAGMTSGDMTITALTVAVGLAAFEIGRSVEEKHIEPGHRPDRP